MTFLQSVILGIVEGFTEFLPISSTAHLVLTSRLLSITQSDYTKTFEIAIQSGAILAVVVLYWRKFCDLEILKKVAAAFTPTGFLGIVFYKVIKNHLIGSLEVILWALALGGIFLIIFERKFAEKDTVSEVKNISYKQSFGIGVFQALAMVPGVSRAAATIVGGMILGVKKEAIVEFSFLLAVPTMLGATGLDLLKSFRQFSETQFSILGVGFAVSFVTAVISIKFLLNYIKYHSFTAFGVYRLLLVAAVILLLI